MVRLGEEWNGSTRPALGLVGKQPHRSVDNDLPISWVTDDGRHERNLDFDAERRLDDEPVLARSEFDPIHHSQHRAIRRHRFKSREIVGPELVVIEIATRGGVDREQKATQVFGFDARPDPLKMEQEASIAIGLDRPDDQSPSGVRHEG